MTAFLAYVFYEIILMPSFGCIFCHQIMGKVMTTMYASFSSFADHMPKMQEAIRWQNSSNSKATALWSPTRN